MVKWRHAFKIKQIIVCAVIGSKYVYDILEAV